MQQVGGGKAGVRTLKPSATFDFGNLGQSPSGVNIGVACAAQCAHQPPLIIARVGIIRVTHKPPGLSDMQSSCTSHEPG